VIVCLRRLAAVLDREQAGETVQLRPHMRSLSAANAFALACHIGA
jgi:hypothetical protein